MKRLGRIVIGALCALLLFFAVLAVDIAWRVWVMRGGFEGVADVALLIGLEAVRAMVTAGAVACAVSVYRRAAAGHVALALTILFAGLWYTKAVSYAAFPGFLQERLARGLLDAGVSRRLLILLFGTPAWALAPAVAALIGFAMRYPERPTPTAVRSVHATGRRGTLRQVALAGTDIRSLVHRLAARGIEAGCFETRWLLVAGTLGAALLAAQAPALRAGGYAILGGGLAVAVAILRSAVLSRPGPHSLFLGRLARAGWIGAAGLLAGGALSFLPGALAGQASLIVAFVTPLAVLTAVWGAPRAGASAQRIPPPPVPIR